MAVAIGGLAGRERQEYTMQVRADLSRPTRAIGGAGMALHVPEHEHQPPSPFSEAIK